MHRKSLLYTDTIESSFFGVMTVLQDSQVSEEKTIYDVEAYFHALSLLDYLIIIQFMWDN